jgi:pimeloyl-ACP methyl ester carboxylesterase
MSPRLLMLLLLGLVPLALADGPGDNIPEKVRPIPPKGIEIPQADREEIETNLKALTKDLADIPHALKDKPHLLELLPDVEVYHKAVAWALKYEEVYSAGELKNLAKLIQTGRNRAEELRESRPSWVRDTGLVVRGFRSKIDGSVQPYGLVVPFQFGLVGAGRFQHRRLDVWLHGRGERTTEAPFLTQRASSRGEFTPADAFVLHPFGRYSNAFKFAGEVDVLEAIEHVRKHYPIDDRRVVMRGFSMGGAGCWQMAAHYPDRWAAAAPGAGFSETEQFLKVFQNEKLSPTWYEKKLWQMYDCPGYAGNFFNLPLVAYSGEKDSQKQAADVMAKAYEAEGMELVHLIGPGTGHGYHAATKAELSRRIDTLAEKGRPRVPPRVRFVTYTLRYDRSYWVRITGMEEHWKKASIDAELSRGKADIRVKTTNVSAFTLSFGPGDCPFVFSPRPGVHIDGVLVPATPPRSDHSWSASFVKTADGWKVGSPDPLVLVKRHGLQGPIDDAFLDSFLMVRPTGKPMHDATGKWVSAEMARAVDQWRKHFRGDARIKDDSAITEEDIAKHNLVLWGDPGSNAVLKKILDKLPLHWDARALAVGKTTGPAESHVAQMIYPNPLNPAKYVVLNSGFTFREYASLNNARQVPTLPDWAVIDVRVPPSTQWPGKVVGAGFFDEGWKLSGR